MGGADRSWIARVERRIQEIESVGKWFSVTTGLPVAGKHVTELWLEEQMGCGGHLGPGSTSTESGREDRVQGRLQRVCDFAWIPLDSSVADCMVVSMLKRPPSSLPLSHRAARIACVHASLDFGVARPG